MNRFTVLDEAVRIVATKANTMNYEKYATYFFAAVIALWAIELVMRASARPAGARPAFQRFEDYRSGFERGYELGRSVNLEVANVG